MHACSENDSCPTFILHPAHGLTCSCTLGSSRISSFRETRTHAAERYLAATSGVEPLFDDLLLVKLGNVEDFEPTYHYNLNDLLTEYNVPAGGDSETCCKKLVEGFFQRRKKGMEVVAKKSVPCFKVLPRSIYSNDQFPDMVVYVFGNIILIIEVHSCRKRESFINSIKKNIH